MSLIINVLLNLLLKIFMFYDCRFFFIYYENQNVIYSISSFLIYIILYIYQVSYVYCVLIGSKEPECLLKWNLKDTSSIIKYCAMQVWIENFRNRRTCMIKRDDYQIMLL